MSRYLKTIKRGNVINFRDRDASPAEGVSLWETCPLLAVVCDPVGFHSYFNDFHTYNSGDWTVTVVDGGTDGAATQAIADAAGGVLLCTTDDAENDGVNFQLKGESFKLASGKALWFEARVAASDATQSDFLVGLAVTDTDLLGAVTDGVYFRKVDGSASVAFVTEKDSTETSTAAVHTAANATYVRLGFWFDGNGSVFAYVDGVLVATHTTNIPDDEELRVSFQYLTGATGVDTFGVDYIKAVQVR